MTYFVILTINDSQGDGSFGRKQPIEPSPSIDLIVFYWNIDWRDNPDTAF